MDRVLDINGRRFIAIETLVEDMLAATFSNFDVGENYIGETERDRMEAYLELLDKMQLPDDKRRFKTSWFLRRFRPNREE